MELRGIEMTETEGKENELLVYNILKPKAIIGGLQKDDNLKPGSHCWRVAEKKEYLQETLLDPRNFHYRGKNRVYTRPS